MELNVLPKTVERSKKRMGRGLGSGKGKTGGRGQKGQKARGKIPAANVGGGLILYKKLPYKRGWSRRGGNPARSPKPVVVKLSQLNVYKANETVTIQSLVEKGIVSDKEIAKKGVKVLAFGELSVAVSIQLPVSENVKAIVEKKGGKVLV
jgi:large subunit ribosomal protein L15